MTNVMERKTIIFFTLDRIKTIADISVERDLQGEQFSIHGESLPCDLLPDYSPFRSLGISDFTHDAILL